MGSYKPRDQRFVLDETSLQLNRLGKQILIEQSGQPKKINGIAYLSQSKTNLSQPNAHDAQSPVVNPKLPSSPLNLACALLLLAGTTTVILQICLLFIYDGGNGSSFGSGIWSGVLVFVTGSVGFRAIENATRHTVTFLLTFSLCSLLSTFAATFFTTLAVFSCQSDTESLTNCKANLIINCLNVFFYLIEVFCLIVNIIVTSQAFCCGVVIRTYNPNDKDNQPPETIPDRFLAQDVQQPKHVNYAYEPEDETVPVVEVDHRNSFSQKNQSALNPGQFYEFVTEGQQVRSFHMDRVNLVPLN